jgi:hypothetical protein
VGFARPANTGKSVWAGLGVGGVTMRALGPGSVSSFLKIILDVVYVALWISLGAVALALLAALLFSFNPDLFPNMMSASAATVATRGPLFAGMLLVFALSILGVLVIVDALRRIFVTLTAGDPFHPDNVKRLRLIGLMLAALELGRYAIWSIGPLMPWVKRVEPNFNLTAWFSVLVVFVLAEVFREGARLRREAELTI